MDKNPLVPLGPEESLGILSAIERASVDPAVRGTMALDFIPTEHRTEEQHQEAAKYWSERGYPYKRNESSVNPSDIPKGTKVLRSRP
jgi:hypothetical protein